MDKQLRLLAGEIIVESDMSKSSKIQLLNFIKEDATDAQVKALLMDGKIVKLDEQAEEIVNDRFDQHKLNEGAIRSIAGMILVGPVFWAGYRAVRAAMSDKSKRCGVLAIGKVRDVCMLKVKAEENKKLMELAQKALAACNQHPKPDKCKIKNQQAVLKYKTKLQKALQKIQNYAGKGIKQQAKVNQATAKAQDPSTKIF